jgi:hypothetical protein
MTSTGTPHGEAGFTPEVRERVFARLAGEWEVQPEPGSAPVYGVLMEWPSEGGAFTLVAFRDGSASVYGSHGSGIAGGYADALARSEARALVRAAAEYHDEAEPATAFPGPAADRVRFYLLTCGGIRVLEAALRPPNRIPERYTGLYCRGMAVFEQLLIITGQHPDPEGESAARRREWTGADGYVHCLLTAMTTWIGSPVVISASAPVPNLVELVAGVRDLTEWLEEQAFPYDSIDARQVVRALRRMAGIHGLPFFTRKGEYHIVYETDAGGVVPCVFNIEVAPFDRCARITLAARDDAR